MWASSRVRRCGQAPPLLANLAELKPDSRLGYGIAAYDEDDAMQILAHLAFDGELPESLSQLLAGAKP